MKDVADYHAPAVVVKVAAKGEEKKGGDAPKEEAKAAPAEDAKAAFAQEEPTDKKDAPKDPQPATEEEKADEKAAAAAVIPDVPGRMATMWGSTNKPTITSEAWVDN